LEFRRDLWSQKTTVTGLSYGVVYVILCLAFLVKYQRLMDGQTNERTDRHTKAAYTALA